MKKKEKIEITKKNFKAYCRVQKSGVTNMWNLRKVSRLSGVSEEKCLRIIETYGELTKKYPGISPTERKKNEN